MDSGDWLDKDMQQQMQVQEAYVEYSPVKKTIEVTPDNEVENIVLTYLPTWVVLSGSAIIGLFVLAVIIRKSGLGFLIKRLAKLWYDTAFENKK